VDVREIRGCGRTWNIEELNIEHARI